MEDNLVETSSHCLEKNNIRKYHRDKKTHAILQGKSPHERLVDCMRKLIVSLDGYSDHKDILQAVPDVIVDYFNARCCWINIFDRFSSSIVQDTYTSFSQEYRNCQNYLTSHCESKLSEVVFKNGKSFHIDIQNIQGLDTAYLSTLESTTIIISPILVFNSIAGAIYLQTSDSNSKNKNSIISLLDGVSMIVAQSIRASRLQSLLESKLLKIATDTSHNTALNNFPLNSEERLDRMARIVAKSLFREMCKAGFGSKQIINTTSEILSELSNHLKSCK